jgi:hypothetical protein
MNDDSTKIPAIVPITSVHAIYLNRQSVKNIAGSTYSFTEAFRPDPERMEIFLGKGVHMTRNLFPLVWFFSA